MQLRHALTSLLLAVCCVEGVVGRQALQRRQDSTDAAPTTTATSDGASTQRSTTEDASSQTSTGDQPTSTSAASSEAVTTSEQQSSTLTTSVSSRAESTSAAGDATSVITASTSSDPTASLIPTATATPDQLPIQPRITPALGVTGVILLIAGFALCLIGIKHRWLYIFLSTALLASLGVTVLIEYVMNPPVSDAIQGAYMVAAVITGLVFGALALVFKEVTDGLGCLLGGFCLAMWFLVLAPGGIIHSTSGRAVLIAVFCLAFLALSFSHYTRNYALILCTSFAGAQIAILGIDCFSRAGLKEFWLYLWNLNDNLFPIDTTTYPITRGIRVEIACTVIIFVFGVMSQFKIWKVIKDRRQKKEADRLQENQDKDQLESAVGREVEANNTVDLERWENRYGDKEGPRVHVDSGVGSSIDSFQNKRSVSVRERGVDDIEMADMPGVTSKRVSKQSVKPTVMVRVASDDDDCENNSHVVPTQSEEHLLDRPDFSRSQSHLSERLESNRTSIDGQDRSSVRDWTETPTPGPEIVPLPFTIPGQEQDEVEEDDRKSMSSIGAAAQSINDRRNAPVKQLSLRQRIEMDRMAAVEDDRASSVAATADEDVDGDALSAPRLSAMPSPYQLNAEQDGLLLPSDDERDQSRSPRRSMIELPMDEDDDEAVVRPETALEEDRPIPPRAISKQQKRRSTAGSHRRSVGSRRSRRSSDSDGEDGRMSTAGSLQDHLPPKMSKVALTYRTNEWAKHIADADQPEVEAVSRSSSPGIQVDRAFTEEAAKPVDIDALKPAEDNAPNISETSSKNPYRRSIQPSPASNARTASGATTPVYPFQRSGSAMSLNRQNSSASIAGPSRLATQGLRSSSMPLSNQPLVESPIEETMAGVASPRNASSPMGMASTDNLMDERNHRLKRKPTSTSFNVLSSVPNLNVIEPSDSASVRGARLDDDNISLSERKQLLDEENMTLAERKALMQQQQDTMQSPGFRDQSASRQGTWPTLARKNSTAQGNLIYDSHQPKRSNTVDKTKQANMYSQWRQSLQQDNAAKQPLLVDHGAMQQMLSERRMAEFEQQRQQAARLKRESSMDMFARSGQLHSAHRGALAKMQAQANRGAPQ